MPGRRKASELAAAAAAAVYLLACCSVALSEGYQAGKLRLAAVYGFECALFGWVEYPFGWLANPLIWAGVVLLAAGRGRAAALCGLLAGVPMLHWSLGWDRQGLGHMLRAGYYLWVASAVVLAAGGGAVWAVRAHGQQGPANRSHGQRLEEQLDPGAG